MGELRYFYGYIRVTAAVSLTIIYAEDISSLLVRMLTWVTKPITVQLLTTVFFFTLLQQKQQKSIKIINK